MNALILICALSVSARDCQKATAVDVFYAPESQENLTGCLTHGMLYATQSGLVESGTYTKVVCGKSRKVAQLSN